jgi:hypothetical protein
MENINRAIEQFRECGADGWRGKRRRWMGLRMRIWWITDRLDVKEG